MNLRRFHIICRMLPANATWEDFHLIARVVKGLPDASR